MLLLATAPSTETTLLHDSKINSGAPGQSTVTSFCSEKSLNAQNVAMMPDYIGQNHRSCATENIMSIAKKDHNLNEGSYVLSARRLKKDTDTAKHSPSVKNVGSMSSDVSGKNNTNKINRTNTTKKLTGTIYALPPTIFHKQVDKYRNCECTSVDNFCKEMCHFRPIRLAPVSPWKCGGNIPRRGVVLVPKAIFGRADTKRYKKLIEFNSVTNNLLKTQNLHNSILTISSKSAFVNTSKVLETDQRKRRKTLRNNLNNVESACDLTLPNKPNKNSNSSTSKSHPKRINKQSRKRGVATKKGAATTTKTENTTTEQPPCKKARVASARKFNGSPPLTRSRLRELRKKNLPNSLHFGLL